MSQRQPVRITITVNGELDPTTVKTEAFSFVLASQPADEEDASGEMTARAATHLSGSLRASAQVLVMAADVGSLLEEALPSFEARRDGLNVEVDAPGLGPEDGGHRLVGRPG